MISSWQDLEDFTVKLLSENNPVKPKGSGSSKKEEDVMSSNVIAQCKYTENKNLTLLSKDIIRLLEAAKLHEKFPLFINSNGYDTIISLIHNNDNDQIIKDMLRSLYLNYGMDMLLELIKSLNTPEEVNFVIKAIHEIEDVLNNSFAEYKAKIKKCANAVNSKYDDLTMYNLFEGENDGVK